MPMKKMVLVQWVLLAGAAVWIRELRRRLSSSQMRGDMYRDISARLDRRLVEQSSQKTV